MDVELPDWMADGWTVRRGDGVAAMVRDDFADQLDRLGLMEAADRPPEELAPGARPFRPGGGRGGLAVLPAASLGEVVVRPYRRGGLPARFVERTYLLGDRAFHEAAITERLRRSDVPVPEPLAAVQSDHGIGYRAALVTRRVTGVDPAPDVLAGRGGVGGEADRHRDASRPENADRHRDGDRPRDASRPEDADRLRDALRRMGRSAGALHVAGGVHADLNAHNFLLPRGGDDAVILDFDRARVVGGEVPGLLVRMNLRRLRRSLDKLGLEAALEAWSAFEEGYEEVVEDEE